MNDIIKRVLTTSPADRQTILDEQNLSYIDVLSSIKENASYEEISNCAQAIIEAISYELINKEHMEAIVEQLISEQYVSQQIGQQTGDAVFIRAHVVQILTYFIKVDTLDSFMNQELASRVLSQLSLYLQRERDYRGFVEGKGWANSVTNAMQFYITAIQHPHFEIKYVPQILMGVTKALISGTVFVDDEEVLMATFIQSLQQLDFPEDVLIEWIEQLIDRLQFTVYEEGYTTGFYKQKTNCIHFLQALYFKLKFSKTFPQLQGVASIFIGKWS